MPGHGRWYLFKVLAAILCIVGIVWLGLAYFIPAPPAKFAIATGQRNQIYQAIGNRYRDILARSHVDLEVKLTKGAVENIELLNDPASGIKAGIAQGEEELDQHGYRAPAAGRLAPRLSGAGDRMRS